MPIKTITAPAIEPIPIHEIKADLRIDGDLTDHDYLIRGLVVAARITCEKILRQALITQTLEQVLDTWPDGDRIELQRPPLQSVTTVKYYGTDDSEQTLSSGLYFVDTVSKPGRVVLNDGESWPTATLRPANAVIVQFVAGHGDDESDVPEHYRHAIRLLVGHWYENPSAVATSGAVPKELALGVRALLGLDRVLGW